MLFLNRSKASCGTWPRRVKSKPCGQRKRFSVILPDPAHKGGSSQFSKCIRNGGLTHLRSQSGSSPDGKEHIAKLQDYLLFLQIPRHAFGSRFRHILFDRKRFFFLLI